MVTTKEPPRSTSLYKRAFLAQTNLILLGGAGVFAVATGSWIPLAIGAGAEALWLALGADSQVFRRWATVQEGLEEAQAKRARHEAALAGLPEEDRVRFLAVQDVAAQIMDAAKEHRGLEVTLVMDELARLDSLVESFLAFCLNRDRLGRLLEENPADAINRDISQAQVRLTKERNPAVMASLQQSLELARKRLVQRETFVASAKAIDLQRQTIEKCLLYLKSHILGMTTVEQLRSEIDTVVTGITSAELASAESAALDGNLKAAAAGREKASSRA